MLIELIVQPLQHLTGLRSVSLFLAEAYGSSSWRRTGAAPADGTEQLVAHSSDGSAIPWRQHQLLATCTITWRPAAPPDGSMCWRTGAAAAGEQLQPADSNSWQPAPAPATPGSTQQRRHSCRSARPAAAAPWYTCSNGCLRTAAAEALHQVLTDCSSGSWRTTAASVTFVLFNQPPLPLSLVCMRASLLMAANTRVRYVELSGVRLCSTPRVARACDVMSFGEFGLVLGHVFAVLGCHANHPPQHFRFLWLHRPKQPHHVQAWLDFNPGSTPISGRGARGGMMLSPRCSY
ncbi:unnamed protein product [Closterium sp. Yama58-4]|nr:unnamed protein product [Closterium sp. Yama58-4]